MAAGLVSHNITTAAGVTFAFMKWVPDTVTPNVGAVPVHMPVDASGAVVDLAQLLKNTASYGNSVTLTRFADTAVYLANDVLGVATGSTAALTFASMGPSGGGEVVIQSATLRIDSAGVISGETSYVLHLYSATPASVLGDNAVFDLPSGDRSTYLGSINLGTPIDLGSTLYVSADNIDKQVKLTGTSIFGYLVTVGTYTPTASRVYVIGLHTSAP